MRNAYLPGKDGDLLIWAQNFAKCLKTNTQSLKLDSKKVESIQSLADSYKSRLEKARDPEHTRMDVVRKNESKKELIKNVRCFVVANLNYHPDMTPALRSAMGLNQRDLLRNQAQRPASKPKIELRPGIRLITVRYRDETSGKRTKPKGVRGITYHWAILDEPPESPESLNMVNSKSSGPLILEFSENQRGQKLYISARWENSRGEPGPWSDIVKTYIA